MHVLDLLSNTFIDNAVSLDNPKEKKKKKKRKRDKGKIFKSIWDEIYAASYPALYTRIHSTCFSIVGDDDLLSAFLSSKKKKKKHSQEKDHDEAVSNKKMKKKRKDKDKLRTEDLMDMFGDTELPWEDPEKLVQLNQVVSMGSHHSR